MFMMRINQISTKVLIFNGPRFEAEYCRAHQQVLQLASPSLYTHYIYLCVFLVEIKKLVISDLNGKGRQHGAVSPAVHLCWSFGSSVDDSWFSGCRWEWSVYASYGIPFRGTHRFFRPNPKQRCCFRYLKSIYISSYSFST